MKTKTWMLAVAVAVSGCVTAGAEVKPEGREGRDAAAGQQLKAVLESLPRCDATAKVGTVHVETTACTRMYCGTACCNSCGWSAKWTGKDGLSTAVEPAQLKQALKLSEGALECEVAAWDQVLAGVALSLDGTACVAR